MKHVHGSGFRNEGSGVALRASGFRFRSQGSEFRVGVQRRRSVQG